MTDAAPKLAAGPMFSTIMPVYNHASFLGPAIDSVLAQTRGNWELIVVDDGSTDGSGQLADERAAGDARITVIHQSNSGPAAARNAGLTRSRGAWITFLDSDDLWFPDTLENFARHIAGHPQVRFIHGYRHRLDEDGAISRQRPRFQDRPTGIPELFGLMHLSTLCVCFRRDLLGEVGLYDPALRGCEDYEYFLRLGLACTFDPLGKPTGLRRRHASNLSVQTGYSRLMEARILQRFVDKQGGRRLLGERLIRRRIGRLYYASGRQYFKSRCYAQAIEAITAAHRHRWTLKGQLIAILSRALLPLGRRDSRQALDI